MSRDGLIEDASRRGKIGTSSVRRIRQLRWLRPDVECVEIRGNVPTRVKLIAPSDLDGVLLAARRTGTAGLAGWHRHPARCSTGILPVVIGGVTLRAAILLLLRISSRGGPGCHRHRSAPRGCTHEGTAPCREPRETFARIAAEREFLHLLKAGCQTPIGAHTWIEGATLHMKVCVFNESDPAAAPIEAATAAPVAEPEKAAAELARLVHPR